MASYIKIRVTNLGTAENPFFGLKYGTWNEEDGFSDFNELQFKFVQARQNPFEVTIQPNLTEALKDAFELDLEPAEWDIQYDGYYIFLYSNVEGRLFYPPSSSQGLIFTAGVENVDQTNIDLTQSLPARALLNAFNDNVLLFEAPDKQKITVDANGQFPITLYPEPTGRYYLNLEEFSSQLINKNKFADEVQPDIETEGYVYPDPSLFLEMELTFSDLFFEQKATVYFLKSIAQIIGFQEKNIDSNYIISSKQLTYYHGYPFDVTIFSKKQQDITIRNKTTGHELQLSLAQYVNRLFFSQGSKDFTLDDVLPMQTGINRLELDFGNLDKQDLTINKKESQCAPYFKFYKEQGGFGYIRFEPEVTIDNRTREGEKIRTDFNGIQHTLRRAITDKKTSVEMEVSTEVLEPYELENFQEFISSPRVEMYVSDLFQKQTEKSWVGVTVKTNAMEVRTPKAKRNKRQVTITFDKYNLHL